MTNDDQQSRADLPGARIAVLSSAGTQLLAKVQLQGKTDGQVTVTASGGALDAQEILKLITEAANLVPNAAPIEHRLAQLQSVIAERLRNEGYLVKDLPSGDIELKFELDVETGLSIAQQSPLHEHAEPNAEIGRNIQQAITGIFTKARDELAETVISQVDAGNHVGVAQALDAARLGVAFMSQPNANLLNALERIDASLLDPSLSKIVRECRLAIAARLSQYDPAARDAETLLKDHPELKRSERANLENILAVAALKRGEVETALSIWRNLTEAPEDLEAELRGWIWRNLSMALEVHDPAARRAAQLSADAFLEAGRSGRPPRA